MDGPAHPTRPVMLRLLPFFAVALLAIDLLGLSLAHLLATESDDRLESERRVALSATVVEVLPAFDAPVLDQRILPLLEQASGFKGLRFDADEVSEDRNMQSVFDRQGRILGWFSWDRERPMTEAMAQYRSLGAAATLGLFAFVGLALWQAQRSQRRLADSEMRAWKLLHEDTLTGLPTQRRMLGLLDRALVDRQAGQAVAFAVVELDGFEETRATIGASAGDALMVAIADRLRELPTLLVARLGEEQFALLASGAGAETARAAIDGAVVALARPFWRDQAIQIRANVGMALAPHDGATADELTRRANLALRVARHRTRGRFVAFEPEMEVDFQKRRFIQRELRRALAEGTLDVHYQPIVTANGSSIVGVEALLRWNHPTRGTISPATFVPVAEQSGMMEELGAFVLRRALRDASRWPNLFVAINLSPLQVRDRSFVRAMAGMLAETGIDAGRVVLEITEGVLIDDPADAKARLDALRGLGVRIALDDFGSGYSNLGYLQHLPVDKLKIDRRFVTPLGHSPNGGVIIQAMVALARALGLSVLAEGVETEEQRVLLRLAGCDEMQGFLFSQAIPAAAIARLAAESGADLRAPLPKSA